MIGIHSTLLSLHEGHLATDTSSLMHEAHQKHESHIKKCIACLYGVLLLLLLLGTVLVFVFFYNSLKDAHNIRFILPKGDCYLIKDALLSCCGKT